MAKDKNPAVVAARAHSNLNTFAAIVSLLEGGHLYGGETASAASKIIKICHAEQAKHLRIYDAAVAAVTTPKE